MKHLTIPPKSPSTQSIVAALVWNEHDAGLHRGRWVESMNFIDCVVSCVATILGRVITILDVLPCVLDDMVNALFVRHRRQDFGFDSDGGSSAPEFSGPHCTSLETLARQERQFVADRGPRSRKLPARHRPSQAHTGAGARMQSRMSRPKARDMIAPPAALTWRRRIPLMRRAHAVLRLGVGRHLPHETPQL